MRKMLFLVLLIVGGVVHGQGIIKPKLPPQAEPQKSTVTPKPVSKPTSVSAAEKVRYAAVSPAKMNVFYIGVDNPISIHTAGILASDVQLSIDNGEIHEADGAYYVRVFSPGLSTITVTDAAGSILSSLSFRNKRIPDPVTKCAKKPGGQISCGELKSQAGIYVELENFDFDARFEVLGYNMKFAPKLQDPAIASTTGPLFNDIMKGFLSKAKPGDIVLFEEIKVKGPDGMTRKLPDIVFQLK